MPEREAPLAGGDAPALQAEVARLNKIIQALMNRAECNASVQGSDFNLFHTAITLEEQVRRRTEELEAALRENEKITRALRESEHRHRLLVENSPMCIQEVDMGGRIVSMNPAGLRMRGVEGLDEVSGSLYLDAVGGGDRERIDVLLAKAYEGETSQFEFTTSGPQGQVWESCLVPIKNKTGRVEKLMSITEDITARKRWEAAVLQLNAELERKVVARTADLEHARIEAEQANRTKSEFLVNMSHEIRTPMNGVIGMIDVLKQSGLQEQQAEMANIIRDSAFALLAVIDDILDFSSIEAGKLQVGATPMAISSVMGGVGETLGHLATNKAVVLTLFNDPAIPARVIGDPRRLRQVLLNLVSNAIKFSGGAPRRGEVSVHATLIEADTAQVKLEFRVTDNGIGMDAATQARLFTAFTQADASTTRHFGGVGLGLAISGQLVHAMGGEIRVQSEPGVGSTFTVHLPFALSPMPPDAGTTYVTTEGMTAYGRHAADDRKRPDEANDVTTAPALLSRDKAQQHDRRILIAEDNDINQKVLLQQLMLIGRTADIANNGREALALWQHGGYGLLLSDLHMPEMDGYELTTAIRAAEKTASDGTSRLPIVAITANALKGEADRCRALGMDDYLTKPVQLVNLKATVEKWLPVATDAAPVDTGQMKELTAGLPVPVDVNVLKALIGDDEAIIREFLHDFRLSAAKIGAELRSACAADQATTAGAHAHKLKSSARAVGALALGELCAEMEKAGKSGDSTALAELLPKFERELAGVEGFLARY